METLVRWYKNAVHFLADKLDQVLHYISDSMTPFAHRMRFGTNRNNKSAWYQAGFFAIGILVALALVCGVGVSLIMGIVALTGILSFLLPPLVANLIAVAIVVTVFSQILLTSYSIQR